MPHENINLAKPFGKGDARFFFAKKYDIDMTSHPLYYKITRWVICNNEKFTTTRTII